jgi:hypothetical protein
MGPSFSNGMGTKGRPSDKWPGGCRDHRKPAQIDIVGDEIRDDLQERQHVRSPHVGLQTLGGAPVLVDEPEVASSSDSSGASRIGRITG